MLPQPQKILIIQPAFLGDVILATSLLETLHKSFPEAEIDFLVRKGNERLVENHPFLHQVLIWDKTRNKHLNLWKMGQQIQKRHYDVVVNLQRFFSTGWLTYTSGAAIRIGFSQNPFSRFFTSHLPFSTSDGKHEIERNHELITDLVGHDRCEKPRLYPNQTDKEAVLHFQKTAHQNYICLAPASVWNTKQFPESKWVEFMAQVPDSVFIYLLGAKEDLQLCNSIANNVKRKNLLNLAGRLSFLQSAELMKGALMNYVNDSAPMHLCSAVNAPTCAIFCSTVPSFGFGPLSDSQIIIETDENLNCRPCGLHGFKKCPEGHFKCAYTISTGKLTDALNSAMKD
jgi:heptosyltransferase-2